MSQTWDMKTDGFCWSFSGSFRVFRGKNPSVFFFFASGFLFGDLFWDIQDVLRYTSKMQFHCSNRVTIFSKMWFNQHSNYILGGGFIFFKWSPRKFWRCPICVETTNQYTFVFLVLCSIMFAVVVNKTCDDAFFCKGNVVTPCGWFGRVVTPQKLLESIQEFWNLRWNRILFILHQEGGWMEL